jgi:hypothetical protein
MKEKDNGVDNCEPLLFVFLVSPQHCETAVLFARTKKGEVDMWSAILKQAASNKHGEVDS